MHAASYLYTVWEKPWADTAKVLKNSPCMASLNQDMVSITSIWGTLCK